MSVFSRYSKNAPLRGSKRTSRKATRARNTEVVPHGRGLLHREDAEFYTTLAQQRAQAEVSRLRNKRKKQS